MLYFLSPLLRLRLTTKNLDVILLRYFCWTATSKLVHKKGEAFSYRRTQRQAGQRGARAEARLGWVCKENRETLPAPEGRQQ